MDKKDQEKYKLGVFYFNKEDKAVFIKRRYSFGYSLNWARPLSWILLAALIALIIILT